MRSKNFFSTLLLAFLIAGTLDMLSAILLNSSLFTAHPASAERICRYIASGVFGTSAFTAAGNGMVAWGIAFHYLIAYVYTAIWFVMYPTFQRIFKNPVLIGLIYGIITWLIMNFIVIPLSNTPKPKHGLTVYGVSTGVGALVICIGIPVALIANWYYNKRKVRS